jgi:hypothetical protein
MSSPNHSDPDYDRLSAHLPNESILPERHELAAAIAAQLADRVERGALPFTLGVFGGWGSGKTTFLAILAQKLEAVKGVRTVYFNAWKYAGLSEVTPSLIYKILRQGVPESDENRKKAAMRVLASLGRDYSDRLGRWANDRFGIDPVKLFRDVYCLASSAEEEWQVVPVEVMAQYYTQVDKAQDALAQALGTTQQGTRVANPVIVLIDELDRCDPDEAFTVIKQLRVLFAMRRLPTAFVVCANPEPIGLAIKHRYGLESEGGDYEARRILEKFVDAYEDFSESVALGPLARKIWYEGRRWPTPWIIEVDEANGDVGFMSSTSKNATVFDMMESSIRYYSNLRVFQKALDYLKGRRAQTTDLIWTLWHLELAAQIDPHFRQLLRTSSNSLKKMAQEAYGYIESDVRFQTRDGHLVYATDKGATLFAILRSRLWETGRQVLEEKQSQSTPQDAMEAGALKQILADDQKMNFVSSLCLLPLANAPTYDALLQAGNTCFGRLLDDDLRHFAWLVRYA